MFENFEETDRALCFSGEAYLLHSSTCSLIASYEVKEKWDYNSSRSIISVCYQSAFGSEYQGVLERLLDRKRRKLFLTWAGI